MDREAPGVPGLPVNPTKEDRNDNASIKPKEFFWDQFVKYLASIMALLTLLDVMLQFFRGSGTVCILPGTMDGQDNTTIEITRDQVAYINTYCQQSLSPAENYPLFVLIQGIFLVVPHFVWESLFVGKFEYFFSRVQQLDRLPSRETGKYREKNFEIVKQLENHFDKWIIFFSYVAKLIGQIFIGLSYMTMSEENFKNEYFSFTFKCSVRIDPPPQGWILPINVSCVYSSFRLFVKLKYVNRVLLFFALCLLIFGIVWCFIQHFEQLGSKDVAIFAFSSGLKTSDYPGRNIGNPFNPRIRNDLDFLILKLFRTDSGHGFVFKDIQVERKLNEIIEEEVKSIQFKKDRPSRFNLILFERLHPGNSPVNEQLAVSVTFGSVGYSLILARKFNKVLSVNFDPFYANEKELCCVEGFEGYHTVTFPENMYAKFGLTPDESGPDPWKHLMLIGDKKINFIIIGLFRTLGIQETVNLFLKQLHDERKLAENCILSTIAKYDYFHFHGFHNQEHDRYQWVPIENPYIFQHKCHKTKCTFYVASYQYRGTEVETTL